MAPKKRTQQKDHEFSMTSGQMVGVMVGLVVIILISFVIGLLIGRYETNRDLVAMQRRANEEARSSVSLGTAPPKNMSDELPSIELPAPGRSATTTTERTRPKPGQKPVQPPKTRVKLPETPKIDKPAPPKKKPPVEKSSVQKPPVEKPKESPKVSTDKYGIQVHGMSNKQNADRAVKTLKAEGYNAWTRPPAAGSNMYGVMVGRFATTEQARASELFKKLKAKEEYADAWIPG